ncbi:unnamed protein product, partial [Heterotrigona itama]
MGNVRGIRYSRILTLDPDCWKLRHNLNNHSSRFICRDQVIVFRHWHDIGKYDVSTMIDHIIEQSKQEKIFMLKQDGTAFFVMASERTEYQEKIIILSASLAPDNLHVQNRKYSFPNLILNILLLNIFVHTFGKVTCPQSFLLALCESIFDLLFGFDGK